VSRTPCRGVVDTSVSGVGCHLLVVLLASSVRLAFHLFISGFWFLFDADPDADPDPTFYPDADPDPDFYLMRI
jgi:hypothetical protein